MTRDRKALKPHAVYRHYDAVGVLLYVGIAVDPLRRHHEGHQVSASWYPEIATITIEWHRDRHAAEIAERRAMMRERPKYNSARRKGLIAARRMTVEDILS